MKTKIITYILIAFSIIAISGCSKEIPGPAGQNGYNGQDATVYYSNWISPSSWQGTSGDWYFDASAPDLTSNIVENGVVLGYVWLAGDLYSATTVRPMPAYAVGANWSFLIHQYGVIQFTSDMVTQPLTTNNFRFIAIPGTLITLKSSLINGKSLTELKKMSYKDVCKLYNIPE